jgi:hypothetical protein
MSVISVMSVIPSLVGWFKDDAHEPFCGFLHGPRVTVPFPARYPGAGSGPLFVSSGVLISRICALYQRLCRRYPGTIRNVRLHVQLER